MKKIYFLCVVLTSLVCSTGIAAPAGHFYAKVGAGASMVKPGNTESFPLRTGSDADRYSSTSARQVVPTAGVGAGYEFVLNQYMDMQVGMGLYRARHYQAKGYWDNLGTADARDGFYQYKIQSTRAMLETTLLFNVTGNPEHTFSPYVAAGIGYARNKAYGFTLHSLSGRRLSRDGFDDRTRTVFAYQLGCGVQYTITQHVSALLGYQYVNLGKATLGKDPYQNTSGRLSSGNIHAHEMLLQLVYAF